MRFANGALKALRVAPPALRAACGLAGVHVLRHTFYSHLAMKGAPPRAVQGLAGHQDLATTQRYLQLSPAAIDGAIRLLEAPTVHGKSWQHCGNGIYRDRELISVEQVSWWRRRESFCADLKILESSRKFEAVKWPKPLKNPGPGTKQVQ